MPWQRAKVVSRSGSTDCLLLVVWEVENSPSTTKKVRSMKTGCKLFLLFIGALVLAGCGRTDGPPTFRVSGAITFDGAPLAEGDIVFRDSTGQGTSSAGRITNGQYAFESTVGKKDVIIKAVGEVPGKVDRSNPGETTPIVEQYLPSRYNDQTTLSVDVTDSKSTNEFDFDLTSK